MVQTNRIDQWRMGHRSKLKLKYICKHHTPIHVTGVPHCGSGTFTEWCQRKGIDVKHEDRGPDGMVSGFHWHRSHIQFAPGVVIHLQRNPAKHLQSFHQTSNSSFVRQQVQKCDWPLFDGWEQTVKQWVNIYRYVEGWADITVHVERFQIHENNRIEDYGWFE